MNYDEEITDIQNDLLNEIPNTYSKIKGVWLWEIFKAFSLKIHELLQLLTSTAGKLNVDNLQGDELEAYVKQWTDLTRKKAQKATGYIEVKGNGTIYSGTIVAAGTVKYKVDSDVLINGTASVPITAVVAGTGGNTTENTVITMVTSNANIKSLNNPKPIAGGTDEETDNALKERYHLRLSMPATSGNKAHYISWAMECNGVGGAKATRDATVKNKVNLYICGDNGKVVNNSVVSLVQNHIDPYKNGDGSGVAPIGAICEVFSARLKQINVSGSVELDNTHTKEATIENIKLDISKYLSDISFQKTELSYAKLLDVAINSLGVNDITNFRINGSYSNVVCEETEIFVLNSFNMEVK